MSRVHESKNEEEQVFITSFYPSRKSTAKKVLPVVGTEEDFLMKDLIVKCEDMLTQCR